MNKLHQVTMSLNRKIIFIILAIFTAITAPISIPLEGLLFLSMYVYEKFTAPVHVTGAEDYEPLESQKESPVLNEIQMAVDSTHSEMNVLPHKE
jgi:hypothetical protein